MRRPDDMFSQLDDGHSHRRTLTRPITADLPPGDPLTLADYEAFENLTPRPAPPVEPERRVTKSGRVARKFAPERYHWNRGKPKSCKMPVPDGFDDKLTKKEVCQKFGVSGHVVTRWVKEKGFTLPKGQRGTLAAPIPPDFDPSLPVQILMRKYQVSNGPIMRWAKELGVTLPRMPRPPHIPKVKLPKEEKKKGRRCLRHENFTRTGSIKEMAAQHGVSISAIHKWLQQTEPKSFSVLGYTVDKTELTQWLQPTASPSTSPPPTLPPSTASAGPTPAPAPSREGC